MTIQKIYRSQLCDTCSFPVFQNGHCDGDDDDQDDGDDDDTLFVRNATGDTDVCHLHSLEDDDDEYDNYDDDEYMLACEVMEKHTKSQGRVSLARV